MRISLMTETTEITKSTVDSTITKFTGGNLIPSTQEIDILASGFGNYLPQLKTASGGSKAIGQKFTDISGREATVVPGVFILTPKNMILGNKITAAIFYYRNHAILFERNKKLKESFDFTSKEFREIAIHPNGTHGFEWLVYLPVIDTFAVWWLANDSIRGVSKDIISYITPIDKRSEAGKNLPYTRIFEVTLVQRVYNTGRSALIPVLMPQDNALLDETSYSALEESINLFMAPVRAIPKTEEIETAPGVSDVGF